MLSGESLSDNETEAPIILTTASPKFARGSSKVTLTSNQSSDELTSPAPPLSSPSSPSSPTPDKDASSSSSSPASPPSSSSSSSRAPVPTSPSAMEMRERSLTKTASSPLPKHPQTAEEKPTLQKKLSRFALKPFKKDKEVNMAKSASLPDFENVVKNKKDCSIVVKVFEARNLPEARLRRKLAEKNSKAIKRVQKMLLEVSSPNLMSFSDATDPYCLIQVDKGKMRTRTIEKKLNPFWCEEFTFDVSDPSASKVILTIVDDKKYAAQGEVIGRLVLPINSFRDQREREQWFPVQQPTSTNKIPQVHMYISYNQGTAENKKLVFGFQILGGRNLGLGTPGAVVPFVTFSLKLKDGTAKDETWAWTEIHALVTERELAAQLESLHITLWRWKLPTEEEEDPDGTSNDKIMLGQANIPVVDFREPRDYWFCLFGKETGLGDLRVKLKYTEEVVLTLEEYQEFLELLQDPKLQVVRTLAAVAKPNTREGIAANLVRVFEKTDKAVLLIDTLNSDEIDSTKNPDIIFRGNSLATKSVDMYMKLVGMPYLSYVLKNHIRKFYAVSKPCEVDPTKLEKGEDLKQNWKNLIGCVQLFTTSIFESLPMCPKSFRQIFHNIQQKCHASFPGNVAQYTAVSGFIFLRFFCPAILAPKLFELAPDHPDIKQTRYLILIAKTLQNLANLVEFGLVKEEYMKNMNEFVLANMETMKGFIVNLATVPESAPPGSPPEINLEKELASMYRHIMRQKDEMIEYQNAKGDPEGIETMKKLTAILEKIEVLVKKANEEQD